MKSLFVLIVFCVCMHTSFGWYGPQMLNCSNTTCSYYYSQCLNDTASVTALICINNCNVNDQNCMAGCYMPMASDHYFWALEFCLADCVTVNSKSNSTASSSILTCMNACDTSICSEDKLCLDAFGCMELCASNDYNCYGSCAAWDSGNTNFIKLAGCVTLCTNI